MMNAAGQLKGYNNLTGFCLFYVVHVEVVSTQSLSKQRNFAEYFYPREDACLGILNTLLICIPTIVSLQLNYDTQIFLPGVNTTNPVSDVTNF